MLGRRSLPGLAMELSEAASVTGSRISTAS